MSGNRWLRLRKSNLKLRVAHEIDEVKGVEDTYVSLGSDPYFKLDSTNGVQPEGWCRIRFAAEADTGCLAPKLYIDEGSGFGEASTLRFPFPTGKRQQFVSRLPPNRALRLDPCEHATRFRFTDVEVTEFGRLPFAVFLAHQFARGLASAPREAVADLRCMISSARQHGWVGIRQHVKRMLGGVADYAAWVSSFDTLTDDKLDRYHQRALTLPEKPLVSVIVPTYNTPKRLLKECLDSVLAQTYPNWQLCIADDCSTTPHVRRLLTDYCASDNRIKVVFRERNGHISAASNSALKLATGEFIALLDHDDVLRPHALSEVMERYNRDHFDIAYSDEDKLDSTGRRFAPFFKPDWNPEFFLSNNYMSHLTVLRRSLVESVGGFRPGFEGAQDYDLFLRATHSTNPSRIHHIPMILYHWRAIEGSTARSDSEKNYAWEAGLAALRDHLQIAGASASVKPGVIPNTFRVTWAVPNPAPLVSILIPTRDRVDLLRACIESIRNRTTYSSYEIIIIDNESALPETFALFERLSADVNVRVLKFDGPFNFSAMNNFGASEARGSVLAFVNNDIEVIEPAWLDELVSYAIRSEIGAVGAKLLYGNDSVQHAGLIVGVQGIAGRSFQGIGRDDPGVNGRAALAQTVSAVTAACLVVRKTVFEQVGGFDAVDLKVAFNDVDLCLKIREAKFRNVFTPHALLYHHESASRGEDSTPENAARFACEIETIQHRWKHALQYDPAYNPNLTIDQYDFGLAWPPRPGT